MINFLRPDDADQGRAACDAPQQEAQFLRPIGGWPTMDALLLSRLQFAFTIAYHIIFPSFTIGLASYLAVLEGDLVGHGPRGLRPALSVLGQDLRHIVRYGRRLGRGAELRDRHQLERLLGQGRAGPRPAAGLRGADSLLHGGELPGRHAVRLEEGRARPALHLHRHRRRRHPGLGLLDHLSQQLDAASGQLHPRCHGPDDRRGLVEGNLLADLPVPLCPYGAGRLSDHLAGGRRGLGLPTA